MSIANLANVAGANVGLPNVFHQAAPVAARAEAPKLVVARNDSSVPTVNMFIDGLYKSAEYAASIIDVCVSETTYAIRCTSGPRAAEDACGPDGPVMTLTAGPATYHFATAVVTSSLGVTATAKVQEECDLQGTTAAVCTATAGVEGAGVSTAATTTTTISGWNYYRFDVAITGGAEKTASPSAECKAAGAGGSGGSGDDKSGASTRTVAMWGLVGVAGVVASLVGF